MAVRIRVKNTQIAELINQKTIVQSGVLAGAYLPVA
jgi:hypothetical protein